MPANWKYVKGLNQEQEKSFYTYLNFNTPKDANDPSKPLEWMPTVTLKWDSAEHSLGRILCSEVEGQTIKGDFSLSAGNLIIPNNCFLQTKSADKQNNLIGYSESSKSIEIGSSDISKVNVSNNLHITNYCTLGPVTPGGKEPVAGDVYSNNLYAINKCEAGFFNTTSDKRAKTNIKELQLDAVSFIKKVPLYSFTYKDTDIPSIGILAQDVQDLNIEGFKVVDNIDATGQNMDYMSIHESKLVYILWQAIKQQQKEIDELKAQLKNK